jgi:AcrR family transcriptional regulator
MRRALLEATLSSLAEIGYARTSTTEVSRRAGVSLGAQLHHFPTKRDLVVAAIEFAVERHVHEVRSIAGQVPEGPDRLDATIDLLWAIMRGPSFVAPFELTAAARTDPELQPVVAELYDRIDQSFLHVSEELFPPPDDEVMRALTRTATRLVFSVLHGLALMSFAGSPLAEQNSAAVLMMLKGICHVLGTTQSSPEAMAQLRELLGGPPSGLLGLADLGSTLSGLDDDLTTLAGDAPAPKGTIP